MVEPPGRWGGGRAGESTLFRENVQTHPITRTSPAHASPIRIGTIAFGSSVFSPFHFRAQKGLDIQTQQIGRQLFLVVLCIFFPPASCGFSFKSPGRGSHIHSGPWFRLRPCTTSSSWRSSTLQAHPTQAADQDKAFRGSAGRGAL